ncbi:hypothetical protein LTR56_003840 [Elasticomyces elasticus]|nr:hypothetical protein LTR22_026433 [Elasticomyces elasticus]KAK3654982.1 hypothetical protein LTR56_003840 [Elasticomyces elasticus]KAK4928686.1 hypothetical protein LTR49_004495 [Elasticomyces elasticus]KAK5740313.1 hypothetical protein LTS12_024989 [Elasticomyces elasticus]
MDGNQGNWNGQDTFGFGSWVDDGTDTYGTTTYNASTDVGNDHLLSAHFSEPTAPYLPPRQAHPAPPHAHPGPNLGQGQQTGSRTRFATPPYPDNLELPQWSISLDPFHATLDIDPVLLQLDQQQRLSLQAAYDNSGPRRQFEHTKTRSKRQSYAQAAQLPIQTTPVYPPSDLMSLRPLASNAPVNPPTRSIPMNTNQQPPIQLSMHRHSATVLPSTWQLNEPQVRWTAHQLQGNVDARPWRAPQENDNMLPTRPPMPTSRRGSRAASATPSRRSKREILSSVSEYSCSECDAGFDTASDRA